MTEKGSFSKSASQKNWTISNIERLLLFQEVISNWKITNLSYEKLLKKCDQDTFIYLDPPYNNGSKLYHGKFDHQKFYDDLSKCKAKCLVSYDESMKDRYSNWNVSEKNHTYTMRSVGSYMADQKKRKELLIKNYNNYPDNSNPGIIISSGSCSFTHIGYLAA